MKKISALALVASSLIFAACSVNPPDDNSALGAEVSADQVQAALDAAAFGVPDSASFHVGDNGVRKNIISVMTNSQVVETDTYNVTGLNDKYICWTKHIVEHNTDLYYYKSVDNSGRGTLIGKSMAPKINLQKSDLKIAKISHAILFPKTILRVAMNLKSKILKVFDKVSVEPSTAVGSALIGVEDIKTYVASKSLDNVMGAQTMSSSAGASCNPTQPTPTPTPSGSPSPTPAPPPPPPAAQYTSKFYGLSVQARPITTNNCAQLPNCRIQASHIEFNEVLTSIADGSTNRIHYIYDISNQMPGLFFAYSACWTTIATQSNGSQLPYMNCQNVGTFQFGSN